MGKIEPSNPSDVPPISDPDLLAEIKRILPRSLTPKEKAQILRRQDDYDEIIRELVALNRTGRPKNPEADRLQIWLAVEVFLARNPGAKATEACKAISKRGGIRTATARPFAPCSSPSAANEIRKRRPQRASSNGQYDLITIADNPKTIGRIHSDVQKQMREDPRLHSAYHRLRKPYAPPGRTQARARRIAQAVG
jgi:hypothetical protein